VSSQIASRCEGILQVFGGLIESYFPAVALPSSLASIAGLEHTS
jgi:hypothetical protein